MFYLLILLFFVRPSWAGFVSLDVGQTQTVFNRFRIPNDRSEQVTIPAKDTLISYRLTGLFDLKSGNQLYFLYAPLELSYKFKASKNFRFNNTSFLNQLNTDVNYKFNSYRVGYLWGGRLNNFRYWYGAVGKIRDANISVTQGSKTDSYSNVGFVPLASLGLEWQIFPICSIYHHTDALGSSRGSAYDSQIELRFKTSSFSTSLGKRILGGGADNANVYNFAQFDTFYLRISYLL